jgi:hypothetical protein
MHGLIAVSGALLLMGCNAANQPYSYNHTPLPLFPSA